MYLGWFCFGGNEIINNPRTVSYARTAGCPVDWFVKRDDEDARAIIQMTEGAAEGEYAPLYHFDNIDTAPWASESIFEGGYAQQFLGVYCLSAEGLVDSTRSADSVQRIGDGGILSRERYSSRRTRFRVLLTATSESGIEYGTTWLNTVLGEQSCQTHAGSSCGTTDMTFFTSLHGTFVWNEQFGASMFDETTDAYTRRMHGCKVVSGPLVQRELVSEVTGARGRIMEFTVEAEQPFIYGISTAVRDPNFGGTVRIQDSPVNYVTVPNARAATVPALLMTNYCLNPSVEVDGSGWAVGLTGSISSGAVGARSTLQARFGLASYQARFTSPAASSTLGTISVQNEVALPTYVAGARWSVGMWAKADIESGTIALGDITMEAEWRTAANAILRTDVLGTLPISGGALALRSLVRPPTATKVIMRARLPIPSRASGAIARLYGDAISVTTP